MESITENLANQIAQMQALEDQSNQKEEKKVAIFTPLVAATQHKPKTPNPKSWTKPDKKPYIIGVSICYLNFLDLRWPKLGYVDCSPQNSRRTKE